MRKEKGGERNGTDRTQTIRTAVRPDNETLTELYKDHSAREIAEMYDVAMDTVRAWNRKARQEEAEKGT